jgi:hypothetical protein
MPAIAGRNPKHMTTNTVQQITDIRPTVILSPNGIHATEAAG